MTTLQEVYNELQNNPQFHEDFKKNPEQALKNAGFELNTTDLAKVKAMLKLNDEKLDDRINK